MYMTELQLRLLIREQLYSDLLLEGPGPDESSFAQLFETIEKIAGYTGAAIGVATVMGGIAALGPVAVAAGSLAAIPAVATVGTIAGGVICVISVGQMINKLSKGDWYGAAYELFEAILGGIGAAVRAVPAAANFLTRLKNVWSDIVGAVADWIKGMFGGPNNPKEDKKIDKAVQQAGATASTTNGSTLPSGSVKVVTQRNYTDILTEIAIDDCEETNDTLAEVVKTPTELEQELYSRGIPVSVPDESDPIYLDYKKIRGGLNCRDLPVSKPNAATGSRKTTQNQDPGKIIIEPSTRPPLSKFYRYDSQGDLYHVSQTGFVTDVGNLNSLRKGAVLGPDQKMQLDDVIEDEEGAYIKVFIKNVRTGALVEVPNAKNAERLGGFGTR
jgi:hypothetical protein